MDEEKSKEALQVANTDMDEEKSKEALQQELTALMQRIAELEALEVAHTKAIQAHNHLREIIESSPVVVFLWRAAEGWPVEFVSNNVEQFGYTPQDFYSSRVPYATIIHPEDVERVAEEVTRYSQDPSRTNFTQEYRIITAEKQVRWTDDRTWIRRDQDGHITHYQGIVLDITERRKAEEERAQLYEQTLAQQEILRALSTPIIPLMERIIVVPLVGSIDAMRAKDLMRTMLKGIQQHRAKVVILDITGVPFVDTNVASHLDKAIQAARLKGAHTILTGISDAVAETIIDLGLNWNSIETLSDLQTGLRTALALMGRRIEG